MEERDDRRGGCRRVVSSLLPGGSERRFALGLVVGKFAPLHAGHEWLIHQAALSCERVLILSYTNPELDRCGPELRRSWLASRFPQHDTIVIDHDSLNDLCSSRSMERRSIPPNSADDFTHQSFLAWLLKEVVNREPDVMFCCESYGPACAELLSRELRRQVTAVVLDPDRRLFPCRAREIRKSPTALRHWLAPEVRAAFVKRIAILGGESSGKTTLSAALAAQFATEWVPEYGRELWEEQDGKLDEQDLLRIAHEQTRREEEGMRSANGYLFCDTSPLTTAGYGSWMFGRIAPELELLATRSYDGIVICKPDFAFVQDGTRRDERFRVEQHAWYRMKAGSMTCPVLEVGGDLSSRVSRVEEWLQELEIV